MVTSYMTKHMIAYFTKTSEKIQHNSEIAITGTVKEELPRKSVTEN